MKKNYSFIFSALLLNFVLIAIHQTAFSQQNIGAYATIDAGFESQSTGNLPALNPNTSTTAWSFVSSGNGQVRSITATGGYGGPKYLSVGKSAPTSNTSTTVISNILSTTSFALNTNYIVQFHYKQNQGTPDTASYVYISPDGTSGGRITTKVNLGTPAAWTKFTTAINVGSTVPATTNGTAGINVKIVGAAGTGASAVVDVDNFVIYPADNQAAPAADITAPNAATGFSATAGPAVVNLAWSAPAAGVDGGGYMVVRYVADPSAEPAPLQNAVYKATSTNTVGTGVVVYVGTETSFSDAGGTPGTNYWYRVYAVDKAFNYSTATTAGPAAPTAKINYYYDGTGPTDALTNWWTNANFTGTHPSSFSNSGQLYRIVTNADLLASLSITGLGSSIIIGDPAGVNAPTVQFNSLTLPAIDSIYQSIDGNPTALYFNTPNVPAINQLFDIFTQVHYRASGTAVTTSTTKDYDKIFIENNADVTFNGGSSTIPPVKTNYFFVEAGATATIGTLSSRWIQIKTGGSAVINGKLITPKLAGLESNNTGGVPTSTGGAIQFDDAGSTVTLGPVSTIEYAGTSTTTTQTITPRADYVNIIFSGAGISKTIAAPIGISGNLTMNTTGASGLILSGTGPITVNGVLTLTAGKINTDATNILVLVNSATVSGGNSTSYVNGPVKRNTAGIINYVLPTGKGGMYRPVTIKPSAATASVYQAEFFNTPYSVLTVASPLTNVDTTYWDVTKLSGASASVALTLDGATAIPNATGADELVVAHFVGATWNNVSATPINPGTAITGTAVSTVQTTFSPFTFGLKPTSTVPVTLISFKGTLLNGKAKLSWTTAEEHNLISYVVEESKDGINFETIGTIAANNITGTNSYSFNGLNTIVGKYYYRLKFNSLDGREQFSTIISLKNDLKNLFSVLNNPVQNNVLHLQMNNLPKGNYDVQLYSMNGQLIQSNGIVYTGSILSENITLIGSLSKGTYLVKLVGNKISTNTEIIIQ